MSAREEYISGLRALADLLEATPELPLPNGVGSTRAEWNVWPHMVADVPAEMARIRRLLPAGTWDKNEPGDDFNSEYYRLTRPFHGMTLELCSYREQVCERVVTGTREVEKQVPTTFETETVTEEIVEWVCKPLLADTTPAVTE